MWIPKAITEEGGRLPFFAAVAYADKNNIGISGSESVKSIETACPFGIAYVPPKGSRAVVLPVGNTAVMCGVSERNPLDLKEGEVGLYSSGGASLILKNDGTVLINGKKFDSEG